MEDEISKVKGYEKENGFSTDRYMSFALRASQLPPGAEWRTVRVKYYR